MTKMTDKIDDHETRISRIEATQEIHFETLKKFEQRFEKTIEKFEKSLELSAEKFSTAAEKMAAHIDGRFASKNDLAMLETKVDGKMKLQAAEGPWKQRFMNLISGVIGAIMITAISLLLSSATQ